MVTDINKWRDMAAELYVQMTQAEKEVYEMSIDWGLDDTYEVLKKVKQRLDSEKSGMR